jgi:hypothetical protein
VLSKKKTKKRALHFFHPKNAERKKVRPKSVEMLRYWMLVKERPCCCCLHKPTTNMTYMSDVN